MFVIVVKPLQEYINVIITHLGESLKLNAYNLPAVPLHIPPRPERFVAIWTAMPYRRQGIRQCVQIGTILTFDTCMIRHVVF